ncbi:hypothetical protein L6164_010903 [Bauhinia variegata]|uniref:Uncharacterized protein n=1 Tax=Bauhinia variegata TaxID=167791 RepID=A0ACB9P6T4_BAUVA|nr:hypothetical protein L6164_010903 [Bauhinia variegata]
MDNVVVKQQKPRLAATGAEVQMKSQRVLEGAQIFLRLVTVVATFSATLCMLTSHQSTMILGMNFDARYSHSPSFK